MQLMGEKNCPKPGGWEWGEEEGLGGVGHQGAQASCDAWGNCPSTSGASLEKHCCELADRNELLEGNCREWYNHI